MSTAVSIRPARPDDKPFVLGLLARLASFPLPAWRTADEISAADKPPIEGWFERPDPAEALLVAEIDETPVGYAYLVIATDFFTQRQHTHLSVLAVSEDAEGRGVGSALVDASIAWARDRGDDRITLNVFDTNTRAQELYARKGFGKETVKYVRTL